MKDLSKKGNPEGKGRDANNVEGQLAHFETEGQDCGSKDWEVRALGLELARPTSSLSDNVVPHVSSNGLYVRVANNLSVLVVSSASFFSAHTSEGVRRVLLRHFLQLSDRVLEISKIWQRGCRVLPHRFKLWLNRRLNLCLCLLWIYL